MKKEITAIMDKILSKGMAIMESEKAQQILSSPQAQKAMDLGLAALTKVQEFKECAKSRIADDLGLVTRREFDELREALNKTQADSCSCECCPTEEKPAEEAEGDVQA